MTQRIGPTTSAVINMKGGVGKSTIAALLAKPEYFATIGFPLLQVSLEQFRAQNRGQKIEVCGVVINNPFYSGGNNGGPEKERAMSEIRSEARANKWPVFKHEIPHSRGFPKKMRGDYSYPGNSNLFLNFAAEFFKSIGLSGR